MQKNFFYIVIFSLISLIAFYGSALAFSNSDLEGTWYGYISEANPAVGVYWLYGTFTLDKDGIITDGSYTGPDGTSLPVTGGQMTVDSEGVVGGTIEVDGGRLTGTFPTGKMDRNKSIVAFVGYDNNESLDIGVAIKAGGSFAVSDLEGTWYAYVSEANPAVGVYWIYGTFIVDSSGKITGGSYTGPDGTTVEVTDGQMTINSEGIIAGTYNAGDLTGIFPTGKMDRNKSIVAFVGYDDNQSLDIGKAIKGGGSFAVSDLEGTWYGYISEANPAVGVYWLYGTFTLDKDGIITDGSYTGPDGTSLPVTGGQMTVDSEGVVGGTIEVDGGRLTGTFPTGKMDRNKSIVAFVGYDNNESLDIGVAIKGGQLIKGLLPVLMLLLE